MGERGVATATVDLGSLTMKDFQKIVLQLREGQPPVKAVKISHDTLAALPLFPSVDPFAARVYGLPVEFDDSLGLFEHELVYA